MQILEENFSLDKNCSSTFCKDFQFAYCNGTFAKIDHFLFGGWNGFFRRKKCLCEEKRILHSSFFSLKTHGLFFSILWYKNVLYCLCVFQLLFCLSSSDSLCIECITYLWRQPTNTNILLAAFSYESFEEALLYWHFRFEIFWRKNIGANALIKCRWNWPLKPLLDFVFQSTTSTGLTLQQRI